MMKLKEIAIFVALTLSFLQVNEGKALYEDITKNIGEDIELSKRLSEITEYEVNKESGVINDVFEDDILLTEKEKATLSNANTKRNAVRIRLGERDARWPDNKLYYRYSSQGLFTAKEKGVFDEVITEIHTKTCIRLEKWTGQKPYYVNIIRGRGCYSYVGRTGNVQELSIGNGCIYKGIIIHELMHALGFWHEQSRPDRDYHVTIELKNIIPGREGNFRKYEGNEVQALKSNYDYGSIMHYGEKAFSKNGEATIVAKKTTSAKMGQRIGMSPSDIYELNAYYECPGTVPPVKTVNPGTVPPVKTVDPEIMNCDFDKDFCKWEFIPKKEEFRPYISEKTPSFRTGPSSPTNGNYLYFEASLVSKGTIQSMKSLLLKQTSGICLAFSYNMNGMTMGKLKVKYVSQNDMETTLWSKSGNQGEKWKEANIPMKSSKPFYIVFVAERGSGYQSDIAIDSIVLNSGSCSNKPTKPTPKPTTALENLRCNFQTSTCGFKTPITKSRSGNVLQFKRKRGRRNYFMMLNKAQFTLRKGDTGLLITPPMQQTKPISCLSFYYKQSYRKTKRVIVYLADENEQIKKELLNINGNKNYVTTQVGFKSSHPYKIMFELKVERRNKGYLILDNINIRQGSCNTLPSCGGAVYDSKRYTCCSGALHRRRKGYKCCGLLYFSEKGYQCCESNFQVVSVNAICGSNTAP